MTAVTEEAIARCDRCGILQWRKRLKTSGCPICAALDSRTGR